MLLSDKNQTIYELLQRLWANCSDALLSKKVIAGAADTLASLPKLILQIEQSEFEFFFHFDDIDQFGIPKYPRRGQTSGGCAYTPSFAGTAPIVVGELSILSLTPETCFCPEGEPRIWGWPASMPAPFWFKQQVALGYAPAMDDLAPFTISGMNVAAYPDTLTAPEGNTN